MLTVVEVAGFCAVVYVSAIIGGTIMVSLVERRPLRESFRQAKNLPLEAIRMLF